MAAPNLGGESLALQAPRALVLRTNIFGWRHTGAPGLAEWILQGLRGGTTLTMFRDVMFSPIAAALLATTIRRCIAADVAGLFHAGGADVLSKLDFGLKIAAAYGLSTAGIRSISVDEKGWPRPDRRIFRWTARSLPPRWARPRPASTPPLPSGRQPSHSNKV